MLLFATQGDLFGGLNDGLLSRAEALAAVDISKHQSGPQPGPPLPQLKHDMVYHHGVGAPPPHNARPHQVHLCLFVVDRSEVGAKLYAEVRLWAFFQGRTTTRRTLK